MLIMLLSLVESDDDKAKITYIYNTYYKFMYKIAFSILKNEPDAEEALSDVFFFIVKNIYKTDTSNDKALQGYLAVLTANKAKSFYSRVKEANTELEPNMDIYSSDSSSDPEQNAIDVECNDRILRIIQSLPNAYREVLECKYVMGLSTREISVFLNRNFNTVHTQLKRGRKIFNQKVSEELKNGQK